MMRILLTGARGMLGRRLAETLGARHELASTEISATPGVLALDITDEDAVHSAVASLHPDWIVNAAAYTAVDLAEEQQQAAFAVNARGPAILARAAAEAGARMLHVSTDFVFDGKKDTPYVEADPTGPLGVYARSKDEGDRRVREACREHVILRLAWLFGPQGKNFVSSMLRLAREGTHLRVVDDQLGTPTFTRDAASVALRVMEAGLSGTIHASNGGETTWFGLARATLEAADQDARLDPIATADYPTRARRPANSRLDNSVLRDTIGDSMRPWQEALKAYLAEISGAES